MTRQRLGRQESRTATRAHLHAAAGKVFARRGYHEASVDEIAEEAGYTKGAVYSNFESKEELFLSLIESRTDDQLRSVDEAFRRGDTIVDRLRNGSDFLASMVDQDRTWCLLYMEFWSYAVRDRKARARFAAQYARWRASVAEMISSQSAELGIVRPLPAEDLATAGISLVEGFVLQ